MIWDKHWVLRSAVFVAVGLLGVSCGGKNTSGFNADYLDLASEEMAVSVALAKKQLYQESLDILAFFQSMEGQLAYARIENSTQMLQIDQMEAGATGKLINRPLPDFGPAMVEFHAKAIHLLTTQKKCDLATKSQMRTYKKTFVGLHEKGSFPAIDGVDLNEVDATIAKAVTLANNEIAKGPPIQ